jgi:hypothetical protein
MYTALCLFLLVLQTCIACNQTIHGIHDTYLYENFFINQCNLFFVDIGHSSRYEIPDTLLYETHLNWRGILIEFNKQLYEERIKSRNNTLKLNIIVGNEHHPILLWDVDFNQEKYTVAPDSIYTNKLLVNVNETVHITNHIEDVVPMRDVLIGIQNVDLLIIDAFGREFSILQSIQFSKVKFQVIKIIRKDYSLHERASNVLLGENGYELIKNENDISYYIYKH